MADAKQLRITLKQLIDGQPNDQRLRDHLEGIVRDRNFPGLTWFWGPILYARNRAIFRGLILSYFSDWETATLTWKRVRWSDHAPQLEEWLSSARAVRDTTLVRRLLRWKHAARSWGLDVKSWNAALLRDYREAGTPAARAIVLDEYNDWFDLDEETALALYACEPNCRQFITGHLPQTFWSDNKRKLWERLYKVAQDAQDERLRSELYRRQIPLDKWRADVMSLAHDLQDPEKLCEELDHRHPTGYGLNVGDTLIALLEARGRDVMPYVRNKLKDVLGTWFGNRAKPFVAIAEREGWWDLWGAAIRADRDAKLFQSAVTGLLRDGRISEADRVGRLHILAGVSREWNWSGFGLAQVHELGDDIGLQLYRRYPQLIHGPYKPHVLPTWWQGYPKLLAAALEAEDAELVDLMASRYTTRARYEGLHYSQRDKHIWETADFLGDYYQAIRDRDPAAFAIRAANVLTQIPAYSIHTYDLLLRSNKLARLLFVRSFEPFLAVPAAVRDLVEGSEIHVQMLSYRILAQDDERARQIAVDTFEILIGTLLRPLHRKTRLAAFGALLNVARADAEKASFLLQRAREALRLPDKKYPKEGLIGLIGQILHLRPELRQPREEPIIYRLDMLEETPA